MGKQKKAARVSGIKRKKKKTFLDNQKQKRSEFEKKKKGDLVTDSSKPRKVFKFENFAKQIASIDHSFVYQLSAGAYRLGQVSSEVKSSVFRETVDHWRELNLTSEFMEIIRKLVPYNTLPQVLLGKSAIVEILKAGLSTSTTLSVQPVLELIAGLATDLQQEFFPDLFGFLDILINQTIKVQNADIIKWCLRCVAHLLKILWRPISVNLEETYSNLLPLFSSKQPDYIRYLGAETVAFLLRKTKDKKEFIKFIINQITDTTDRLAIAKLLFETAKTVNDQFNSNLDQLLVIVFDQLPGDCDDILTSLVQFCCDHAGIESATPLYDAICRQMNYNLTGSDKSKVHLECLTIFIRSQHGKLVKSAGALINYIKFKVVPSFVATDELIDCVMAIVESTKLTRTDEQVRATVAIVFDNQFNASQVMGFVDKFKGESSLFESYILKPYLGWLQMHLYHEEHFSNSSNNPKLLKHLMQLLLLRQPSCRHGLELLGRSTNASHFIDLHLVQSLRRLGKDNLFPSRLVSLIDANNSSVETVEQSLIICSTFRPIDTKAVLDRTHKLIQQILDIYTTKTHILRLLPLAIQTVVVLSPRENVLDHVDVENIAETFLQCPTDATSSRLMLQALNFTLTCESWRLDSKTITTGKYISSLSREMLEQLFTALSLHLADSRSQVRMLALQSLCLIGTRLDGERKIFSRLPKTKDSSMDEIGGGYLSALGLLECMLEAEQTAENLTEYKRKLSLLQNIEAERMHESIRTNEKLNTLPLRFLLGSLYTNFTLLWAPLQSLVAGYGNTLKQDQFWGVFGDKLRTAGEDVCLMLSKVDCADNVGFMKCEEDGDKRVDYIKYRNQLWNILPRFPGVCEVKNRQLVTIFLDNFLDCEYKTIRQLSDDRAVNISRELSASTIHSLIAHLSVFPHFKDLKSLHRVSEVRSKVDELLCHRVAPVQKIALDILVAFKLKYLIPYKENLLRLLEDKDFKGELMAFSLGIDSSAIRSEHRNQMMPVVLRLLYGRLRAAKRGKKDGGKNAISARRNLILHHMRDLTEEHQRYFLRLVFEDLYTGCKVDDGTGNNTGHTYDYILAHNEAPVKCMKQLQAALEMLEAVMSRLGQLIITNRSYILQTIIWIGFIVTSATANGPRTVGAKAVRNAVYTQLAVFYTRYADYTFSEREDEAVMFTLVWPPLENFHRDYIHSARGLLHLVQAWSRQPAHRRLLKYTHPVTGARILENISKVLNQPITGKKVVDTVLDVFNNLVMPTAIRNDNDSNVMDIDTCVVVDGADIALPEMDTLLVHFNTWIMQAQKDDKQLREVGVKLDILRHLSPHIEASDMAGQFVAQLMVMLAAVKKPEVVVKVLGIVQHLVNKIEINELTRVARQVLPYFGRLVTRQERVELANLMATIRTRQTGDLDKVCDICINLNAYDKKRFEEPDFEVRMNQFIRVREDIRAGAANAVKNGVSLSLDEVSAVFYTCCFAVKHENDSSLKTNALDTLLALCTAIKGLAAEDAANAAISEAAICAYEADVNNDEDEHNNNGVDGDDDEDADTDLATSDTATSKVGYNVTTDPCSGDAIPTVKKFITKTCFEQIKLGLKSKEDMVRCDFIGVLQKLVLTCHPFHPRLKDLAKLTSTGDPDSDFFENVRHVQMHRRGRALARLSKQLQEQEIVLNKRNLTQLLMPLCTQYLMNADYVKNSQLIEQAISLLGAICRVVPWAQYEVYVKYYTTLFNKETQHQRQLVKITTEVLNAFHFSLDLNEEGIGEKELNLRRKYHFTVNSSLLPKLIATLSGKTKGPVSLSDEDQLIQRVPLAVPIVRILQLNDTRSLERGVPGVIAKTTSFLKSKAVEIREAARSTLCSVMELLGARFVAFTVRELASFLTRGFQVHVLTYTVHTMLHQMSDKNLLKAGDLDGSVSQLTEIALMEMFGVTAEEKDVKKITGKVMEAKNTKSYDTMQILARYISSSQLMAMVKPFSDKLSQLTSFKSITKIKECLRNMVIGLLDNSSLDANFAMIFIYGVVTDQIELGKQHEVKRKDASTNQTSAVINSRPTDTFIVPVAPRRGLAPAKHAATMSQHVVHEFGLNLLYFLLKRASIEPAGNDSHRAHLEPLLPVLINFLRSSHPSVVTVALRCFQWVVKVPLLSRNKATVAELTECVFALLKKYGGGTDGRGENHDLVVMASKLLVILIRDVKIGQMSEEQLKLLFQYILVDVLDPLKQTTAFGLLSAVLTRRIVSPDLHDIMMRLVEMSIQSHSSQVRQSARAAITTYVANYDLKKKLNKLVDTYVAQLDYAVETGRLVAAESLKSIISIIGQEVDQQAQFLFVSMAPHLINDESEACRQAVASAITQLLRNVQNNQVTRLVDVVMTWFKGDNLGHCQLACRLFSIVIDTLGLQSLKSKLNLIEEKLPIFAKSTDSLAVQALSLLQRIVRSDKTDMFWKSNRICDAIHQSLLHPHAWVRLLSAQLVGLFLARGSTSSGELASENGNDKPASCKSGGLLPSNWLTGSNTVTDTGSGTLKSVILDSFEQLNLADNVTAELSVQVVKNLVALTKLAVICSTPSVCNDTNLLPNNSQLSLKFLLKKCVRIANHELASTPTLTVRRTLIFNYMAAVCLQLPVEALDTNLLKVIIPPLQREVSSGGSGENSELRAHCQEVLELIKSRVGNDEVFTRTLLVVQLEISKRRGERAASRKQALIRHPHVAVKRRLQQNEAKRSAKKARKLRN